MFRWIKRHPGIREFAGNSDNAIRLRLFAAMIAFAPPRIAARANCVGIDIPRFTELVRRRLFARGQIAAIEKPRPVNPARRHIKISTDQPSLARV